MVIVLNEQPPYLSLCVISHSVCTFMHRYVWEHFSVIWCDHCSLISELSVDIPALSLC